MKHKFIFKLTTIFWALVGVFVVIISDMILVPLFFPTAEGWAHSIPLMFISWVAFFLLGLALIILVLKKKVEGLLKKFLLLTGASAIGVPVFAILHNLVYGLFIYFFGQDFWERIGPGGDEPFFFILAVIVCPLGFLVGVIGTIVLLKKGKRQ